MVKTLDELPVSQTTSAEPSAARPEWSSAYSTMLDDFEAILEDAERITKASKGSSGQTTPA
jgi:hypothetical protein